MLDGHEDQIARASMLALDGGDCRALRRRRADPKMLMEADIAARPHAARQRDRWYESAAPFMAILTQRIAGRETMEIEPVAEQRRWVADAEALAAADPVGEVEILGCRIFGHEATFALICSCRPAGKRQTQIS
jgi:hypothetical protein